MKLVYHIRRRNARESARKIGKIRMNGGMVVRTREKVRQCDPEKGRTRWPHGAVSIKSHTEQSYRESLTMLSKPGVIPGCRTVRSKPRCRNGLSVRRSQTMLSKQRCRNKEVLTKRSAQRSLYHKRGFAALLCVFDQRIQVFLRLSLVAAVVGGVDVLALARDASGVETEIV